MAYSPDPTAAMAPRSPTGDTADRKSFQALFCVVLIGFALVCVRATPVRASSELCVPEYTIDLRTMDDCRTIVALNPGNDTRANVLLLLADRDGRSPAKKEETESPVLEWREFRSRFAMTAAGATGYADGEGSRCRSNEAGKAAFVAAVKTAADLSTDDRDDLLAARDIAGSLCQKDGNSSETLAGLTGRMRSKVGKGFATYLHGVAAFYDEHFDEAADDFGLARGASDSWLADTAAYMVARTRVNRMQRGAFDQYGSFAGSDHVDQQAATSAQASLDDYLVRYPEGRYVRSARGLLRRVAWLAGWTEKLAEYYNALLSKPAAERGIDPADLADEIDSKLLPVLKSGMTRNPILLAVLDLRGMRNPGKKDDESWRASATSQADLEAQHAAFSTAEPLLEFLKASQAFYVDSATEPVVRTIRDDARRRDGDNLWFSRQMLRGAALEAKGDRNARGFWKELHSAAKEPLQRSTVELAIALDHEAHGDLAEVFAPGSPVRNAAMRSVLIRSEAGPDLLRRIVTDPSTMPRERGIALYTLLRKELARRSYASFLADLETMPSDASDKDVRDPDSPADVFVKGETVDKPDCPTLQTTVSRLAAKPGSQRDQLCLGDFIRVNNLDEDRVVFHAPLGSLGGAPSQFPGQPVPRQAIYSAIIADAHATAQNRSYALYRAVKCYEPTGLNGCGGAPAPKAERKAWFYELKRAHPSSSWAQDLHYWW